MQCVTIENLNATVSRLGFGAMRLPTLPNGEIDEAMTAQMVDYAIQHGVNYFDTAYMYMGGKSENVMGKILKNYPRDSFYLADKMPLQMAKSAEDVKAIFADQLSKCQVEYFDFYLLHAMDRNRVKWMEDYKAYDYLNEMKKSGKIRRFGFSFHDNAEALDAILSKYAFDFVQVQLNYLDWTVQNAKAIYEVLEKHQVPGIVMEPVRGGYLHNLPADVAEIFEAAKPGRSYASWAIRWVAKLPQIKIILSGMSNMEQVIDNVKTFTDYTEMTADEARIVEKAAQMLMDKKAIACTACRYCEKCPKGIAIPEIFALYNRRKVFGEAFRVMQTYATAIPDESKADRCIACGYCVSQCPQQLEIPELLKACHAELITRGA